MVRMSNDDKSPVRNNRLGPRLCEAGAGMTDAKRHCDGPHEVRGINDPGHLCGESLDSAETGQGGRVECRARLGSGFQAARIRTAGLAMLRPRATDVIELVAPDT